MKYTRECVLERERAKEATEAAEANSNSPSHSTLPCKSTTFGIGEDDSSDEKRDDWRDEEWIQGLQNVRSSSLNNRQVAQRQQDAAIETKVAAPKDTVFCVPAVFCMPTITVNVDDTLKEQMEKHPEINWSEVTRQAIRSKIEKLELMDELTADSELSDADVDEIAAKINESARKRVEEESE